VYVGDGKGADALLPFWRKLKRSSASITAVAMDMSPAYIAAVTEHLPKATIVFDHFHLIKLFNDKLAGLRRDLQRDAQKAGKWVLKGTRWLLLKNQENLRAERNEQQRLQEALSLNEPLAIAYYLKEDLRRLWLQASKHQASLFLDDWLERARISGVKMLVSFADTLEKHRDGILAYYDYPISTGPLEGTNNKITTLQRQAYGFRDMQFFKLKIFGLHETKYALVG
jgi:transposase